MEWNVHENRRTRNIKPYNMPLLVPPWHIESYWAWSESLTAPDLRANSESLEPTEPPRCKLELRWCRHRKDPTCVVGEQRQFFHLALCLPLVSFNDGDTSNWECFLISSKSNPGMFIFGFICCKLIFGGFCSISSILLCCNLEKNVRHHQSNEHLRKLLHVGQMWFHMLHLNMSMPQFAIFCSSTINYFNSVY